jgi:hypothetical protein
MSMMDELVGRIAERVGLPPAQAEAAARAAVEFLDDRLPPPVGGNLAKLVQGGGGGGMPDLGNLAGGLGGMFGGK